MSLFRYRLHVWPRQRVAADEQHAAAISLARESQLPILVFNLHRPGAFASAMRGEGAFTIIRDA